MSNLDSKVNPSVRPPSRRGQLGMTPERRSSPALKARTWSRRM